MFSVADVFAFTLPEMNIDIIPNKTKQEKNKETS